MHEFAFVAASLTLTKASDIAMTIDFFLKQKSEISVLAKIPTIRYIYLWLYWSKKPASVRGRRGRLYLSRIYEMIIPYWIAQCSEDLQPRIDIPV